MVEPNVPGRWSREAAQSWYATVPWLLGANFVPSTAINQLEMFQADTWDPETIDRELGWAAAIGMNSMRVYLHDLLWVADAAGFKRRLDEYLGIAARHGMKTLLVFFDDCHRPDPAIGKQPGARPGCHNPGWVKSPGPAAMRDPHQRGRLEDYVKDILTAFGSDPRVLMWDLYNEPGNHDERELSFALLADVFGWARAVRPSQPLTAGVWAGPDPTRAPNESELEPRDAEFLRLNRFMLEQSDVLTFHNYDGPDELRARIAELERYGRPLVCTEYLARGRGSRFQTHIPIFRRENVGAYNWGLVWGKTGTIYPWGSPDGAPEPNPWFHDILRPDGTPFDPAEVELLRRAREGR